MPKRIRKDRRVKRLVGPKLTVTKVDLKRPIALKKLSKDRMLEIIKTLAGLTQACVLAYLTRRYGGGRPDKT